MKSINLISSLMDPISTQRGKLGRLKREKREDTYIGGGGVRAQRRRPKPSRSMTSSF